MGGLVFENAGEKLSGLRIGVEHLCISGEAACRRLLGEMQECEERLIGFFFYPQVIEPAFAGSKPVRLEPRSAGLHRQQLAGAAPEQIGVALLVSRVAEEEPSQDGVMRQLGRARQIAAAVGLGLRETQQLPGATVRVDPDPAMQRLEQPVDGGRRAAHGGNAST